MYYFLLGHMLGDPSMLVLDSVDVIFTPSSINTAVEEFSIRIPLPKVGDSGPLLLARSFNNGQCNDSPLEPSP